MDDDIESKQNYLREEIMDQNYDPELFSEFLASKKGEDALNLELWTFRELQDAVSEFKTRLAEYNKDQAEKEEKEKNYFNEDPYHQQQQQEKEKINEVKDTQEEGLSKKASRDNNGQQDNNNIDYTESVPAKKLTKSVFEQYETITISITNVEKNNQGSIFTKAFVTYRINTEQLNLSVVRRYSDFKLLQELLQSVFIGSCIPPIPAKKYGGDAFTDSFVNKRKRYLERFIRALITIPIVRNSPILYDFLSIVDDVEFKKSMTKHNDLIKPGFSNILSNDGLLDLHVSKEADIQIEQIKVNNTQNELLLSKLSFLSKSLYQEIQQVSNRMIEITEVLQDLNRCSNSCNDNEIITDLYKVMSKVMKKWSDCEKSKATLIETNIREHFKYIKNEFGLMKELFDKREASHRNFHKIYKQLMVRKEDLFRRAEIRSWELSEEEMKNSAEFLKDKKVAMAKMLPKKTDEVNVAKKELGYFTTAVLSEYKRLRRINGVRCKENCAYLSDANNEMINSLYQMWADALMAIAGIEF